jgi:hypothetical protein
MRLPIAGLIALAAVVLGACVEPNLGDSPFFCNNGLPECPEGYECDRPGGPGTPGRCVKPGSVVPPPPDAALPDRPTPDLPPTVADLPQVKPDTRKPDGPAVKWDTGPIDMPPLKPDGIPAHLGCQSNTECTGSSPCCCPTPLLPMIWSCLPLCFDPFCI